MRNLFRAFLVFFLFAIFGVGLLTPKPTLAAVDCTCTGSAEIGFFGKKAINADSEWKRAVDNNKANFKRACEELHGTYAYLGCTNAVATISFTDESDCSDIDEGNFYDMLKTTVVADNIGITFLRGFVTDSVECRAANANETPLNIMSFLSSLAAVVPPPGAVGAGVGAGGAVGAGAGAGGAGGAGTGSGSNSGSISGSVAQQSVSNICKSATCSETEVGPFMKGITAQCYNLGNCQLEDIMTVFANLGNWIFGIIGIAVFVMYIWGGLHLLFAAGNSERIQKGKQIMTIASVGLLIVLGAYTAVVFLSCTLLPSETFQQLGGPTWIKTICK